MNTPSTADELELMDGGGVFFFAVAEAAKDRRVLIWNVRNMCETSGWLWICVGMVIVMLTVLSDGPFANPIGQMTEVEGDRRECCVPTSNGNELKHHEKVSRSGLCVEPHCV